MTYLLFTLGLIRKGLKGPPAQTRNDVTDQAEADILAKGEDRFRMKLNGSKWEAGCSIGLMTPSLLAAVTARTSGSFSRPAKSEW